MTASRRMQAKLGKARKPRSPMAAAPAQPRLQHAADCVSLASEDSVCDYEEQTVDWSTMQEDEVTPRETSMAKAARVPQLNMSLVDVSPCRDSRHKKNV